MLNTDYLEF